MNKIVVLKDHTPYVVWLEPLLWILLSLAGAIAASFSWSSAVTMVGCVACLFQSNEMASSYIWRKVLPLSNKDPQGRGMMMVAIPLLLQAMSRCNSNEEGPWLLDAKLSSLLLFGFSTPIPIGIILGFAALAIDPTLQCLKSVVVVALYMSLSTLVKSFSGLHQVFTMGEWNTISGLVAVAIAEFGFALGDVSLPLYAVVSLSGMAGCGVGCIIATKIGTDATSRTFPIARGLVLVLVPFCCIETALFWQEYKGSFVPRCIAWIVSFLNEPEGNWPRGVWLLYWVVLLGVTLPLAPRFSHYSVVVARKWFHFVAVLLFCPVTLLAPQLMSLSYAIALSLLMITENVRPWLPAMVQDFYNMFLHLDKDMPHQVTVTHMALIAGCAMPLWIAQLVNYNGKLLPLWGCICLGVGDSMGAIVGSVMGKTRWHLHSNRTIEGSLAVWISMVVTCHVLVGDEEPWLAAVTCVALLEAWTQQIDNLVLPLAGTTVVLMQQCG